MCSIKTLHFKPIACAVAVFSAVVIPLDALLGLLFPNWWVMPKAYELLLPGSVSSVGVRSSSAWSKCSSAAS